MLLSRIPGIIKRLGNAATRNTGVTAGTIPLLEAAGKMPAVDGSQLTGIVAGAAVPSPPQGRLTLSTGVPVMVSTVSAATTIYYSPYVGGKIPIYNGTEFTMTTFAELSVLTTDATKSPAAIGASKVNDWFVWSDAGTMRVGHGPDWTNDTTRSAGTALVRVNGILLNNAAITNGPAASRGTYVGTTRSNASSQLDWIYGSVAAGGGAGFHGIWNAYNRRPVMGFFGESADNWTYTTAAFRAVNASNAMRVSFVQGLQEDPASAEYVTFLANGATNTYGAIGIGLDSTTTPAGMRGFSNPANLSVSLVMVTRASQSATVLGFHFLQALEYASGATVTFYGDAGVAGLQAGVDYLLWA